jgi:hypothetical protein
MNNYSGMSKTGPGAQPLPTNKKPTTTYATPPTLAGKKGVASMGVPTPQEKDLSERPTTVKKLSENSEKKISRSINTSNMSKSLFDKLFENVMDESEDSFGPPTGEMSDEAALGIEGAEDSTEQGGEDEVTLTLDRATAEKLHSALGALLGGEDEEAGEEFGEEDFGGDEDMGGDEEQGGGDEDMFSDSIEIVAEPKELKNDGSSLRKGKPDAITGSKVKGQGGKAESGSIPEVQANPKAHSGKGESLQKHGSQKVSSFKTKGTLFDL